MAFPNALMQEQAGSPEIRQDESYKTITRVYQVTGRLTESELIQGEYLPEDGYTDPETDALYESYEYISTVAYPVVRITFRKRLFPQGQYDVHTSSYEAPLEINDNFKMYWKYNLYSTGTTTVPNWADDDADDSHTVGQAVYQWAKAPTSDYKVLVQSAIKFGVETFLKQTTVITKRKTYNLQSDAQAWLSNIGYLCAPFQTYGLTSDATYWLIRDARLVEDRDAFAVTVEFLFNAESWDTDIYTTASITDEGF
jgi:hypothetical protein